MSGTQPLYSVRNDLAGYNVDESVFDEIFVVGDHDTDEDIQVKIQSFYEELQQKYPSIPDFGFTLMKESEAKEFIAEVKSQLDAAPGNGRVSFTMNVESDEEMEHYEQKYGEVLGSLRGQYGDDVVLRYLYVVDPGMSVRETEFLMYRRQNRLNKYGNCMTIQPDDVGALLERCPSVMDLKAEMGIPVVEEVAGGGAGVEY